MPEEALEALEEDEESAAVSEEAAASLRTWVLYCHTYTHLLRLIVHTHTKD